MADEARDIVDWGHFEKSRSELGPGFIRIISYFKEDGVKSISQIEMAMHQQNTAALVIPAHTLKGESRQFGAEPLSHLAEEIEHIARACVETRDRPDQALEFVVKLRPTFEATLTMLEREANPLVERRPVFGRRA